MPPSDQITHLIASTPGWRGKTLADVRKAFLSADKAVVEAWKWMGSPVWECDGMLAVANAHKEKVKVTFSHGAKLVDAGKVFNAGLDGGAWRAIDFLEGDKVNQAALKALVREAIAFNRAKRAAKAPAAKKAVAKKTVTKTAALTKAVKKAPVKAAVKATKKVVTKKPKASKAAK